MVEMLYVIATRYASLLEPQIVEMLAVRNNGCSLDKLAEAAYLEHARLREKYPEEAYYSVDIKNPEVSYCLDCLELVPTPTMSPLERSFIESHQIIQKDASDILKTRPKDFKWPTNDRRINSVVRGYLMHMDGINLVGKLFTWVRAKILDYSDRMRAYTIIRDLTGRDSWDLVDYWDNQEHSG